MSLADVLREVQALSPDDKLKLMRHLTQENADEKSTIEPGKVYPIWSPDQNFTAAAALLEALDEDRGRS